MLRMLRKQGNVTPTSQERHSRIKRIFKSFFNDKDGKVVTPKMFKTVGNFKINSYLGEKKG